MGPLKETKAKGRIQNDQHPGTEQKTGARKRPALGRSRQSPKLQHVCHTPVTDRVV